MATPANPKLQLQTPTLFETGDQDLPTVVDDVTFEWRDLNRKIHQDLKQLTAANAPRLANGWIAEATDPSYPVVSFDHDPAGSCFRNASISALMNCSPFINFLEQGKSGYLSSTKLGLNECSGCWRWANL